MRKFWLFHSAIFVVLRFLIGAAFVYAGAMKIKSPQAFADSIASFQILPRAFVNLLALGLPPLEVIVGFLLILGWKKRMASLVVVLLSVVFAFALASALARGLNVDCGCFGEGKPSPLKTWMSLGRDLLLGAGALLLYAREKN